MKVTTVEKEVKTEQQVIITRSELEDVIKKSAAKAIDDLDVPPTMVILLACVSAELCVNIINYIFEKEDK